MKSEFSHLFIGIELDIKLVERLTLVQEDLGRIIKARNADVRWVKPELIHLTLCFLGERDDSEVPDIKRALDAVAPTFPCFPVTTAQLGAFPNPKMPRILFTHVYEESGVLDHLKKKIDDEMEKLLIPLDKRPYLPHITLGRVRTPGVRLDFSDAIKAIGDLNFGTSDIFEVVLFGSSLHPSGPKYSVISRHLLNGALEK